MKSFVNFTILPQYIFDFSKDKTKHINNFSVTENEVVKTNPIIFYFRKLIIVFFILAFYYV